MRIRIDPLPGESLKGCLALGAVSAPATRLNALVFALYGAVAVAAFLLTPSTRLMTTAIGIGAVLSTLLAYQWEGRARLRRLQASDPHALETHFVELGPEGVRAWCAHVDMRYRWADFSKVTENREFYLLVRRSGGGSAIPKRILDEATDAELRARIREWAPDRGENLAREVA